MGIVLTALATLAVLFATLRPDFSRDSIDWANCVLCGQRGAADAIVNVLLFLPIGVGLRVTGLSWKCALALGVGLSTLVEAAQLGIPGRDPSLGDILFNAAGASFGRLIVKVVRMVPQASARTAARVSLAASTTLVLTTVATAFLLSPTAPDGPYVAQWAPNVGYPGWYRGQVQSASVASIDVASGPLGSRSRHVQSLLTAGAQISVIGLAGPPTRGFGSLFRIVDEKSKEVVQIGPHHNDLVFRYRTRGAGLLLDQPDVRFVGAMKGVAVGDRIEVRVRRAAALRFCLEINDRRTCNLGFGIGSGWTLLYYSESFPDWMRGALDALWIAAFGLAVGFWARRRWETVSAVAVVIAALWILPKSVGLMPTGLGVSLAAALGMTSGLVIRCATSSRSRR